MGRLVTVLLLGIVLNTNLYAKKLKAKIRTEKGIKEAIINVPLVGGNIMTDSFKSMRSKVKYFDKAGNKHFVKPDEVIEIVIFNKQQVAKLHPVEIIPKKGKMFLLVVVDSEKVKGYNFVGHQGASSIWLKKEGQKPVVINYLRFKKDMSKRFNDCPDLVQKIKNKVFTYRDLIPICEYYSKYCG